MRMMHEGCWWRSGSDWPSLAWRSMRTRPGSSSLGGSPLKNAERRAKQRPGHYSPLMQVARFLRRLFR